MLINKTLIVLIIVLCTVGGISGISIPQNQEKNSLIEKNKMFFNFQEIKSIWDNMSARYINIAKIDLFAPFAVVFAGTAIIIGIDFFLRRRTDNVIKRFSSHFKNK